MQKLLIRVWDTLVRDGIGTLCAPWAIKREARARAEARRDELLILEKAEQDIEDVRRGNKRLNPDGTIEQLPASTTTDEADAGETASSEAPSRPLHEPQMMEWMHTENALSRMQEQVNLAKTVIYAEEEVADDDSEPPEAEVDFDWLHRWRESAKTVTSEELQRLWARTLAGEIKAPGSYSLRTLDFLKNLLKTEAELIEKIAPFIVDNAIFDEARAYILANANISYADLLELQELGILAGVDSTTIAKTVVSQEEERYKGILRASNRALMIEADKPPSEVKLELNHSPVTKLGREVLSLGRFAPDEPHLRHLGSLIAKREFVAKLLTLDSSQTPSRIVHQETIAKD